MNEKYTNIINIYIYTYKRKQINGQIDRKKATNNCKIIVMLEQTNKQLVRYIDKQIDRCVAGSAGECDECEGEEPEELHQGDGQGVPHKGKDTNQTESFKYAK